ncbi:hypothetical protein [Actinopolymorpha alba]|uniref:hypothetical protein n=1 Tax=Actinopolymorpha alba TaxID=533267 RepID=UPI00037476E6|nr:hypothetical protein [Actinopolymorpha alba]
MSTEGIDLRHYFRSAWGGLPALLAGSVLSCVATALVMVLSPGINPVSVLLAAVLVGPTFAALADIANQLWDGADVGIHDAVVALRGQWRRGVAAGLVLAVPLALFLVALEMFRQTGSPWALVPMSLSGAVTVVAALTAVVALPRSLGTSASGWPLWIASAHVVARNPAPALAVHVLAGLGVWACVMLTASIYLVVPGAVALAMVAAARTSMFLTASARRQDTDP